MMSESDLKRFIRDEIAHQVQVLLFGVTDATTESTETISQNYPGMPNIEGRPVMHPYGLVSRAPRGTISVVGRIGEHIGNKMTLGHRDKSRPTLNEGEVILYDQFGHAIYLSQSKIQVGSKSSSEPLVLGLILKKLLADIITAINGHTHIVTGPGSPTAPTDPGTVSALNALKSSPIEDKAMLSDKAFTEK